MTIRFTQRAVVDLEHAHDYYAEINPQLGGQFLDDLDTALDRLEMFPAGAPPVDGFDDLRRARMRRFPYGIFYRHSSVADDVLVVRVLHTRRHHPGALGPHGH